MTAATASRKGEIRKASMWVREDIINIARRSIVWSLSMDLGTYPKFYEWRRIKQAELWHVNKKGQGTYAPANMIEITAYA